MLGIIGSPDRLTKESNAKVVLGCRTKNGNGFAVIKTKVPLKHLNIEIEAADDDAREIEDEVELFAGWKRIGWEGFALTGTAIGRFEKATKPDLQWFFDALDNLGQVAGDTSFPSADGPGPTGMQGGRDTDGKAVELIMVE